VQHRKLWIALILALAGALLWLAFFWEPVARGGDVREPVLAQAPDTPAGGDFVLRSPSGSLALSSYRGQVVLIYFGYTYCPDICPTSLASIAQALSALTPAELAQVAGLFVSLDPERDTMEVLQAYAPFFHPAIVGVGGSAEQVAQVARQYGVRYMKQKSDGVAPYSIDHSSSTYVVARDGKLATTLPHGSSPQGLVDTIRALLAGSKAG
jgi:protein SCO1/2